MTSSLRVGNTSRIIEKGEGRLSLIVIGGNGANGTVSIYDGVNTKAQWIFSLFVLANSTIVIAPPKPIIFHNGLYVGVNASTTYYTLQVD